MTNPWDQRYATKDYFYGKEPNSFLIEAARHLKASSKVLCIGDGEGRNSVYLAKHGHAVTSVDLSRVGLEKMQKLATDSGVHVTPVLADLAEFDFGHAKWDAIVSIWCHTPSGLRSKIHKSVARSLVLGGLFFLEAYTPEQLNYKTGGPPDVDMLPTLEELKKEFSAFNFLLGQEIIRSVHEGLGHNGQSAVLQVIAKK